LEHTSSLLSVAVILRSVSSYKRILSEAPVTKWLFFVEKMEDEFVVVIDMAVTMRHITSVPWKRRDVDVLMLILTDWKRHIASLPWSKREAVVVMNS